MVGIVKRKYQIKANMAEDVADLVGAMLTGNTETNITVTYQDTDNTIDFVVADPPSFSSIIVSGTVPAINFTDTDTGADSVVTASSTVGTLAVRADTGNEVANSHLFLGVDGSDVIDVESTGVSTTVGLSDPIGRLQAIPRSTTAALAAIGNAINTTNKFAGKVVINTTAGTIVTAAAATAAGVWLALDGTTAHTPV